MTRVFSLVRVLFFVFLALFLLGGVAIVGTQALGVLLLNGGMVTGATKTLAPWVFSAATVCSVCAFVLRYQPSAEKPQT